MGCPPGVSEQRLLRDNETVLLEGTSWKHQAHAADGAARLIRKVLGLCAGMHHHTVDIVAPIG
jgi:hypothetical protein